MAAGSLRSPSSSSSLLLSFKLILLFLSLTAAASAAIDVGPIRHRDDDGGIAPGRKVGGRAEVRGVQTDREVQDLGLFCVEEHNRRLLRRDGDGDGDTTSAGLLTFRRVVAAQRQVVSGIKYYLRIAAFADGGERRSFDAVVVVKPWLPSRTLISFGPEK